MPTPKNAAIILLGMGESCAAEVLKTLNQKDVETIIDIMNEMEEVSEHEVIKALNEFFKETHTISGLNVTSGDYIRNTLVTAVGSEKAGAMMEDKSLIKELNGIELLKWQPIHLIVHALKDEHPQVITAALMCLDSEKAAAIFSELPKDITKEIIRRMAQLAPLSQIAMQTLSEYLEEQFTQSSKFKILTSDAVNVTADLISRLAAEDENEIISYLTTENRELADMLQEKLFPFDKLAQFDNKSLQVLLAEVEQNQLVLALKGADEDLKIKFFKCMSKKSIELLIEDMESLGPVKINDILQAQKNLVQKAKQLAAEDKIAIPSTRQNIVAN